MAKTALKFSLRALRAVMLAAMVTAVAGPLALGQQNAFDTGTPAESRGGTALLSSFAQDKIETVNLANGNLSVHIPLVAIGGRGMASYTVALAYNSKLWTGEQSFDNLDMAFKSGVTFDDLVLNMPNIAPLQSGWFILRGPVIKTRLVQIDWSRPLNCPPGTGGPTFLLTKMWLVMPDGSEIELRDNETDGQPGPTTIANCQVTPLTDRYRGRVWHSTDGSAITYVSNVDNGGVTGNLAGFVFLADGTRFNVRNAGRVDQITDRNGNWLRIAYDDSNLPSHTTTYTDQLGRQVILQYTAGGSATITVKGYNGVPDRSMQVITDILAPADNSLAPNLRADFQDTSLWPRPFFNSDRQDGITHTRPLPHTDLFPYSDASFFDFNTIDQRRFVTRLNLLDGRNFQFHYNPFGELAEIIYPGGGISQIDYAPFGASICETGVFLRPELNRRVSQRRNYNGGALEATWLYSRDTATVNMVQYPRVTVEAHQGDQTGALLMQEKHYFLNLDKQYLTCSTMRGNHGTGYDYWDNAKEFQVERLTSNSTLIETIKRSWEQRTAVAWDPNVQPQNDPRVFREDTLLDNDKMHRVDFEYDNNIRTGYVFNNVTDIKEYDWGTDNHPGGLRRETVRAYVNILNDNCYLNLNGTNSNCPTSVPGSLSKVIHKRRLLANETIKDGSGTVEAYTEIEYDNYAPGDNLHAAIISNLGMTQYDGTWFTDFFAADHQPRGNVTSVRRWISGPLSGPGSLYTAAYNQYDEAGNVVKTIVPNGLITSTTTISYQDNYGDGTDPGAPQYTPAAPTFARPTLITNSLGQQSRMQYDYTRGIISGIKDANATITRTEYDQLDRPILVTADYKAQGPEAETNLTRMSYPTASANEAKVSKQLDGTRWLTSRTQFDGFGRPVLTSQSEDGKDYTDAAISYTIHSQTIYDGLGRASKVSNPYRSTAASTDGWSRVTYDLAGRVKEAATFSGGPSNPPPAYPSATGTTGIVTTSYSGEVTTVRDQANKQRSSTVDGLGRLVKVEELQEYPSTTVYAGTTYNYDARGNLVTVSQSAQGQAQTRRFAYDGLSRLIFAANPEQQTVNNILFTYKSDFYAVRYDYDLASNLVTKTDTRKDDANHFLTINYGYDSLNRMIARSYSNDPANTPTVSYSYDTATKGIGRLASVSAAGVSTSTYSEYDVLGRVKSYSQATTTTFGTQTYPMSYVYNKAGLLTDEAYPSGKQMHNEYDGAGRVAGVKNQATGYYVGAVNTDASNRLQYTSHGAVTAMKLGNTGTSLWEKASYNSRLQVEKLQLGTAPVPSSLWEVDYTYGVLVGQNLVASMNNGNLQSQKIVIGTTELTQSYTYDRVNRLSTAQEVLNGGTQPIWVQSYAYDEVGNRLSVTNTGTQGSLLPPPFVAMVNGATNQLVGYPYDAAGNQQQDRLSRSLVYDGESRLKDFNNSAARYLYDGDGRRVVKIDSGGTTVFVYNAIGQMVAEYKDSAVSGQMVTSYLTTDHLGSTRVVVRADGSVKARLDYLPYGEEIPAGVGNRGALGGYGVADSTRQKFTGKERDSESVLDYFGARYYSGGQGRFTSVDPENAGSRRPDPQSWNGYAYVRNNPLIYVDPDGKWFWLYNKDGDRQYISDENAEEWKRRDGVRFSNQIIYDRNGNEIGTYRRMWEDGATDLYNQTFYGRDGLIARANAMQEGILVVGAVNLAPLVLIGGTEVLASGELIELGIGEGAGTAAETGAATIGINARIYAELEKQLAKDGAQSIFRALRSAEKALQDHVEKLPRMQYKSQVEKTIRNVQKQIETIKQFIKDKGL